MATARSRRALHERIYLLDAIEDANIWKCLIRTIK